MKNKIPKLSLFTSLPGTMINPQWLKLPISWTIFCGPKNVQAIEAQLYLGVVVGWGKGVVYLTSPGFFA